MVSPSFPTHFKKKKLPTFRAEERLRQEEEREEVLTGQDHEDRVGCDGPRDDTQQQHGRGQQGLSSCLHFPSLPSYLLLVCARREYTEEVQIA